MLLRESSNAGDTRIAARFLSSPGPCSARPARTETVPHVMTQNLYQGTEFRHFAALQVVAGVAARLLPRSSCPARLRSGETPCPGRGFAS